MAVYFCGRRFATRKITDITGWYGSTDINQAQGLAQRLLCFGTHMILKQLLQNDKSYKAQRGIVMVKPWKSKRFQLRRFASYKCRCNIRKCQARVTRRLHPSHYEGSNKRYGKCPELNCHGTLYVDWFRMWSGNRDKDRGAMCKCSGVIHPHTIGYRDCLAANSKTTDV